MAEQYTLIYQPDIKLTLADPEHVTVQLSMNPEKLAGFNAMLLVIFTDDQIGRHIRIANADGTDVAYMDADDLINSQHLITFTEQPEQCHNINEAIHSSELSTTVNRFRYLYTVSNSIILGSETLSYLEGMFLCTGLFNNGSDTLPLDWHHYIQEIYDQEIGFYLQ